MGQPATMVAQTAVPATAQFDASTEPIIVQEISLPTSPPPPPPPPTNVTVKETAEAQCQTDPPKRKRGRPRKVVVATTDATTPASEPPVKRLKREVNPAPEMERMDGSGDGPESSQAHRGVVTLPKIIIPPTTTQPPFPLTVKLVIMR